MLHPCSLLDPEVAVNPYPFYQKLRAEAPVYWDEGIKAWLISRYADVAALLRDQRFTSMPLNNVEWETRPRIMEVLTDVMQFQDPPKHTLIRGLIERVYNPLVPKIRARTQQLVDGLLDVVQNGGHMDLIQDFAASFPFTIVTELVGVQGEDRVQFQQWANSFARFALFTSHAPTTPEEEQQLLENIQAFANYIRAIVEQRRKEPKEDLITALIHVEVDGYKLSEKAVVSNCVQLSTAGFIPITDMFGNGMLALLRHPDQMQKLLEDPTLLGPTIEELIRYDTFLQWVPRRVTEDIELHGQLIHKNQIVQFGLGSANHDETQFYEPDRFDITRTDYRHVGFGGGSHMCLGASLVRLVVPIAVKTVLHRLKNLRLITDDLVWVGTPAFRILESLPVTFEHS